MIRKPGEQAPDCEFLFFPDETSVTLKELLSEGPVVLLFAKQSCPTCQWAFPFLDRLAATHPALPSGRVFMVLQEDSETAVELVDQYQLETPVLLDPEPHSASEAFGLRYVPDGILIEESGKIQGSFESFDKGAIEEMAVYLEKQYHLEPARLYPTDEGIPAFRPG